MECALVELELELQPLKFGNFTEDCMEEREDMEDLDNSTGKDIKDYEVFDFRGTVNIVSYSVMSAVGIILNSAVLIIAGKQSKRADLVSRTNVHFLVFHLTLADVVICFITMPLETVWRVVVQWHAGNIACKVLMMIRTGGYLLSSLMLVVLSLDRYISISQPFSSLNLAKQRRRARLMVVGAWLLTLVFSSPQAVIFRLLKHPDMEFYQCTTIGFWEGLASPANITVNGSVKEVKLLWGIRPIYWSDIYHTVYNCEIFLLPLITIVTTYIRIYFLLSRRMPQTPGSQTSGMIRLPSQESQRSNSVVSSPASARSSRRQRLQVRVALLSRSGHRNNDTTAPKPNTNQPKRSVLKALKMSLVHVLAFVISWTPYTVMGTWDSIDRVFEKNSSDKVPPWVRDVLYLTAVLNSCINPIIYGVYFFTERRKRPNRINYANSMSMRSVREKRTGEVVTATEASATTFLMRQMTTENGIESG